MRVRRAGWPIDVCQGDDCCLISYNAGIDKTERSITSTDVENLRSGSEIIILFGTRASARCRLTCGTRLMSDTSKVDTNLLRGICFEQGLGEPEGLVWKSEELEESPRTERGGGGVVRCHSRVARRRHNINSIQSCSSSPSRRGSNTIFVISQPIVEVTYRFVDNMITECIRLDFPAPRER